MSEILSGFAVDDGLLLDPTGEVEPHRLLTRGSWGGGGDDQGQREHEAQDSARLAVCSDLATREPRRGRFQSRLIAGLLSVRSPIS